MRHDIELLYEIHRKLNDYYDSFNHESMESRWAYRMMGMLNAQIALTRNEDRDDITAVND